MTPLLTFIFIMEVNGWQTQNDNTAGAFLTPLFFRLVFFHSDSDTFYSLDVQTLLLSPLNSFLFSRVFKTFTGVPAQCKHVSDCITLTFPGASTELDLEQEACEDSKLLQSGSIFAWALLN